MPWRPEDSLEDRPRNNPLSVLRRMLGSTIHIPQTLVASLVLILVPTELVTAPPKPEQIRHQKMPQLQRRGWLDWYQRCTYFLGYALLRSASDVDVQVAYDRLASF